MARARMARQFYVPSMNNRVDNLYNSIKKSTLPRNCQRIRVSKNTGDPYKKDNMKGYCPHKKEINTYLASLPLPKGAKTLVLDAKDAMTTRELLKNKNIATIDIPNNQMEVSDLLMDKFNRNKRVNVHYSDAYDYVVQNDKTQYDIQYYDMCGWFVNSESTKSYAIAKHVLQKDMVAPGGYLAFTIYNGRTSTDQEQACVDLMKPTGFKLVKAWKYGNQMVTLVFKKPEGFDENLYAFLNITRQMVKNGCPRKKALKLLNAYLKYHK